MFIINKWCSIVFSQSIFLIFSILRSSIPNFLGKFNESVRLVAEKFTLIKTSRLSNTIKIRHPLNRIERKGWIKIYSPPSWNDGIKLNTDPDKPKVLHIYATFRKQYVYPWNERSKCTQVAGASITVNIRRREKETWTVTVSWLCSLEILSRPMERSIHRGKGEGRG